MNKNNLISIPRAPQLLNHQQRQQPLKFVLLNARSIRMKTLLLRDYIVEHDIDLFAITETWLTDDSLDEFYCRDICPEGYNIERLPRNYAHGGGVVLVYRRCFKVRGMYKRSTGVLNSLIFILHQFTIIILGLSLFTELHLVLGMDSRSECFWRSLVLFWRDLFRLLTPC